MSTIPLTERDQAYLTAALDLDARFPEAAAYLRSRIPALKGVKWAEPDLDSRRHDKVAKAWETLFRVHRGSLPPIQPASQPRAHTPAPRPEQTYADGLYRPASPSTTVLP